MRSAHTPIAVWSCSGARSSSEDTACGPFTTTSCAPDAGPDGKQVHLTAAGRQRIGGRAVPAGQGRVEVGHHAHPPAGAVRCGPVLAKRVQLGGSAVLVALGERVALGVDRGPLLRGEPGAGPLAALAGGDHPQARQGVYPELRHFSILTCKMPSSRKRSPRGS